MALLFGRGFLLILNRFSLTLNGISNLEKSILVRHLVYKTHLIASINPPITLILNDMLLQDGNQNINLFSPHVPQNMCQPIIQMNLSLSNADDHLIWKSDPTGAFFINSTWNSICNQYCPVDWAQFVWQTQISLKFSYLSENCLEISFLLMLTFN